jgi:biopolymer transport protein ExbD
MPLKLEQIEEPGLNLTPMIDIVLLLVIFFMVGTEFTRDERQYEIELPRVSDAQPLTDLPDELVVNITRSGEFALGHEPRTLEDLEADLRAASQRYRDQVVVIYADGAGPYQHVMTALSICQRADISNVQLANRVEPGEAP